MVSDNLLFRDTGDAAFLATGYGRQIVTGKFAKIGEDFERLFCDLREFLAKTSSGIADDLFVFRDGTACRKGVFFDAVNEKILWPNIWKIYNDERGTVYLRGLQKHLPDVETILAPAESYFPEKRLFANLFISPRSAVGLKAHFDPTDFFVFQISGRKEWQFWPAPNRHLADEMMPEEMALYCAECQRSHPPARTITLEAGHAIYVPVYTIHAPITRESASTHVTLGLAHPALKNRIRSEGDY